MSIFSPIILSIFVISLILPLIANFTQNHSGQSNKFNFSLNADSFKKLLPALIIFPLLYIIGGFFSILPILGLAYFVVFLISPWFLGQVNLNDNVKGALIAGLSFLSYFTLNPDIDNNPLILSSILGLIVWKVFDALGSDTEQTNTIKSYFDILPSLIWFAGSYWIGLTNQSSDLPTHYGFLLGSISIALILQSLGALMGKSADKKITNYLITFLALPLIGGLALFFITENILLAHKLLNWVYVFSAGMFVSALIAEVNSFSTSNIAKRKLDLIKIIISLTLIGIASLLASRLIGNIGWLVIAASALPFSVMNQTKKESETNFVCLNVIDIFILFAISRALLQGFLYSYNANLTGINLVHPYVSAALFAGILLIFLFPLAPQYGIKRNLIAPIFILKAISISLLSNYFLHEEATGSLLIAAFVNSLCIGIAGKVIYNNSEEDSLKGLTQNLSANIILIPVLLIVLVSLSGNVLGLGNMATKLNKFSILGIVLILNIIAWFVYEKFVFKQSASEAKTSSAV
ncbi:MAG: hypothetical protein ACK481_03610 [Candidatus Melainabacteria bacterium]|jgi:hypothetical protein